MSGEGRRSRAAAWGAGLAVFLAAGAGTCAAPARSIAFAPEILNGSAQPPPPPGPEGLSAVAGAGFNLLFWKPVRARVAVEGYHVYRSLTPGGPYSLVSDAVCAPECVFVDRGVVNGTWYYYVVRAHDAGGREGPSSEQAAAQADTAPPGARIQSLTDGQHFTGNGPQMIAGTAVDAVSGLSQVRVGIMRNDTKQWWNGKAWAAADRPAYLPALLEEGGVTRKWHFDAGKVAWRQATSYTVAVMAGDSAGYEVAPANAARIYVDTPAELTASVAAAPAKVTEGQAVNVSVLIANTGGSQAVNVRPGLPVPEGEAEFILAAAPDVGTVASLEPGEFATFSWTFSSTAAGAAAWRAGCEGTNALTGVPARAVSGLSNAITIQRAARLEVEVAPSPSNVRAGTSFTVRMRIANVGQSAALVDEVTLKAANPALVRTLHGPDPAPPFRLKGGETRELVWQASAGDAGVVAFTGAAMGRDLASGSTTDSGPRTSLPVGVASAPATIQLAAAQGSAVVGSAVEVTAVVRDAGGTPVPGMPVGFGVLAGGGAVVAPAAITDEYGQATTMLRLGGEPGMATVEGRAGAVLASISIEGVLPGGTEQVLTRNFFDPGKGETADVRVYQPRKGHTVVQIFSLGGDRVATLADADAPAGWTTYTWDGNDSGGSVVPNGVYFFSVKAGGNMMSRRIIVLRR